MRVLCVAEKPSIAKSITQILSGGRYSTRDTRTNFIKNYDFDYPQANAHFTVTAVAGHLTQHSFHDTHQSWNSCDPFDLFDAPVKSEISNEAKSMEANLTSEARRADMLMIWTDCDREGEHIGSEIARVCRKSKRNIVVKRARFSAIIAQQIHNAAQHPVELDQAQADAVEARTVLDLKIGAAFTRYQTKTLKSLGTIPEETRVISYGPCQFPTLGFVVARYNDVQNFVAEAFWYIYLALMRHGEETKFSWRRGHLFDMDVAAAIYQQVLSNVIARVTKVTKKSTKKWKPLPLTTVELQKAGSRFLRLAPKKVLDIAEKLYQQGFLSYPRTETDQFDPQFDFMTLIDKHTVDPAWGQFATSLRAGQFNTPRRGKNDDKAHPPIHPTAHAANLTGDEKRVYEFVTRRFLACCSKDAVGSQTTVDVICGGEEFYATGLIVHERNYLDVYPYDKWTDHALPDFEEGEEFQPSVCELRDGQTSPPSFLTEADLVSLMDKNGIGTDATIAQHIETVIKREYVIERFEGQTKYLVPSTLGIGLIEGYNQIGFDKSLSKPQLRRETERAMVQVCERAKTKNEMLNQALEQYKEMYVIARREFDKVISSVRQRITRAGERGNNGGNAPGGGPGRGPGGGGGGGGGGSGGNVDDDIGGGGGQPRSKRGRGGVTRGTRGATRGAASTRGARNGSGTSISRQGGSTSRSMDDDDDLIPRPPPYQSGKQQSRAQQSSGRPPDPPVASTSASTSNPGVNCSCGTPAVRKAITNETASKGKQYWACPKDVCGFFQWTGDRVPVHSIDPGPSGTVQTKQTFTLRQNNSTNGPARQCKCNVDATMLTVVKEGANKGRKFWRCAEDKCNFFEFDDEPPRAVQGYAGPSRSQSFGPDASKTVPTKRAFSSRQNDPNAAGPVRQCKCGTDATLLTVVKEGANQGRKFWKCADKQCDFFEFDDEPPRPAQGFAGATGGGKAGADDECYKCHMRGHWASACPNDAPARKRSRSFGSKTENTIRCYKCDREGHFSNACPNEGSSTRGRSKSMTSTRGGRGSRGRGSGRGKRGRGTSKTSTFAAADGW